MDFTKVSSKVVRESEKAYQLEVSYWTKFDAPIKTAKMWCPKSCSKVENGVVVEVATFILDKWVEEHNNYVRQHTRVLPNISFDIAHKEALVAREKEDTANNRAYRKELVERAYNVALPYADARMREMASIAIVWGGFFVKNKKFNVAKTEELVALGHKIEAVYGLCEKYSTEEIASEVENYLSLSKDDFLRYGLQEFTERWIFGDLYFRLDESYNERTFGFTQKDFYNITYAACGGLAKSELGKKFKKQIEFTNAFKEIYFGGLFN